MLGDREDVMRLAHGRWPNILIHFGVEERAVSGKHSPCPMCEGKDRFRLISGENGGRWICNQCGSGDGMDLLTAVLGCDFKSAADKLRPIVCEFPSAPPVRGPNKADRKKRLMKNLDMWKEAVPDHKILAEYLEYRGLRPDECVGADIRLHPALPLYDENGKFKRKLPCMLARISTRDGKLAAIHRTYLFQQGGEFKTSKKISKTSREWGGGAIRLLPCKNSKRIIVGEGIETVLSVRAHVLRAHGVDIPCWAGVSANNLEKIAVPDHIENIMVAGDNDLSFTGQKAAYILANRLTVHDKRRAMVSIPTITDTDFNDQLRNTNYG